MNESTVGLPIVARTKILVFADDRMPVFANEPRADGHAYLAVDEPSDAVANDYAARFALDRAVRFIDPMFELGRYDLPMRSAVVRALALAKWRAEMRYCPICARPLAARDGRSLVCSNEPPHRHFPRTDPATIMLVSDGERVLLGRQASWPPGMYSTLAGFVDAGETAEAAVVREVREEAGIEVTDVRYFGSESWPFPRSLMLGFTARATTFDVARNDEELEDVRWFDVERTRALSEMLATRVPFGDTIARRLIRAWLDERTRERET